MARVNCKGVREFIRWPPFQPIFQAISSDQSQPLGTSDPSQTSDLGVLHRGHGPAKMAAADTFRESNFDLQHQFL